MYPNVIVPFNGKLDWKCKRLDSYSQLQSSNLAWETNLKTGASAVNIQVYIKNKAMTLDNLDKVLLVIDDCGFDDFGENVVLCRPISNGGSRATFKESVRVAETCYHYIRQMTKRAEIAGYGKGIAANILLATAVKLHDEYCYSFSVIFVEESIIDIKKEFEESHWIGTEFMISWFRKKMMAETYQQYGLHKAEFGENIKKL
ncbi:hypothetical protein GCK72_005547 [Caenorhabditis remanei]|uniref:Uncharacterized protein n=1 Tax=Caenorhabditis remanei TaxID=31234 RepID=A0A6A5HE31_CAERE|nr:hypothetical protein GCK72_005547 [Caenorhabditis remanei]KAF1765595.1 hypothetical protein GCK72_005547 [Caenorhabditis remanei]